MKIASVKSTHTHNKGMQAKFVTAVFSHNVHVLVAAAAAALQ